jgi:small subunit ribosomal protein S6
VKKYEGLFILNIDGSEESIKDALEKVNTEITAQGGKVESVTKMDKRPFARTPDKKVTSGYYVNIVLEAPPAAIEVLRSRFALVPVVYRVMFNKGVHAVVPQEEAPAPAEAATETTA